jgi:hypothetical protein
VKIKQGMATALALALVATFSTYARAAERPGQAMADVTARLAVASSHAAVLEEALNRQPLPAPAAADAPEAVPGGHDIGPGSDGGGFPAEGAMPPRPARKITPAMIAALDGLEAAMEETRTLARGHEYLEPGIEHVLANAKRIRANRAQPADATALSHEITIELFALANNARILEAEADLHAASTALGMDRPEAAHGHMKAAARVMNEAREQGAYHLEDDIATLQVILARIDEGTPADQAVTADGMNELIGDLHEHLSDLRGE